MKLLHLGSIFLSGAVGITLAGWALSLAPFFIKGVCYCTGITILLIALGFILDDPIVEALEVSHQTLYAILIASAGAYLLGAIVLVGYLL